MDFSFIEDGKEVKCKIVLTFKDEATDIDYVLYTDGSLNDKGELEVFASRYELENNNYVLYPIENDSEWDLVDEVLESRYDSNE